MVADIYFTAEKAVVTDDNPVDTRDMRQVAERDAITQDQAWLIGFPCIAGDSFDPAEVANAHSGSNGNPPCADEFGVATKSAKSKAVNCKNS